MTLHFSVEPVVMRIVRKKAAAATRAVGASEDVAREVELAVGEALANTYVHAYDNAAGPVEMEVEAEPGHVAFTVRDQGESRRMVHLPETLSDDPWNGDGVRHYGLYVIKQLVDEVTIVHPPPEGRGTSLHFVKRFSVG